MSTMVRYLRHLIICFLLFGVCQGEATLQRKKRWLVFPKGSSLQYRHFRNILVLSDMQPLVTMAYRKIRITERPHTLVYCFLVSTFGTRDGIFVVGVTVGLAWEIPQNLRSLIAKEAKNKVDSRHRRELYSKIRLLLDRQGVDGMNCVLRAICESKRVSGTKLKFIHSLLHGLFSLPDLEEESEEYDEHMKFKSAEQDSGECEMSYPCPIEIFHFK